MSYRTTCAVAKGSVRCVVLADRSAPPRPSALDARAAFHWQGLPCAVTHAATLRCFADQRASALAQLGKIEAVAVVDAGRRLCGLARTAVTCLHDATARVIASNITAIAGDDWLWGLRTDGAALRLDTCPDQRTACSSPVDGMRDLVAIASGAETMCGLARDGRVSCTTCDAKSPCTDPAVEVRGVSDATTIAVGRGHACVVRRGGEVACWGRSECGQAGGDVVAGDQCRAKTTTAPTTIRWAK